MLDGAADPLEVPAMNAAAITSVAWTAFWIYWLAAPVTAKA
jgi:hypothetical protein